MTSPVLSPVRPTFRALAATIVPEAASLEPDQWLELEAIVESYLARRPETIRRQMRSFITLLGVAPLFRYGRTFAALDPQRRTRLLSGVQNSSITLVRRGFWGLRTLVHLGYYSRAAAAREIGYRATARGWEARR
jgi:hypothetical protein